MIGKKVLVKGCDTEIVGIVTGYDEDIGITIQTDDEEREYLYCLIGPQTCKYDKEVARKLTKFVSDKIESGILDIGETREEECRLLGVHHLITGTASIDTCPFSQ